ncbi:MAG: hypothetical protein HQ402_00420 [Parcubacteria group bacterium]|nr:hypothetical protein [Parcubacteria group bacterium]
MSNPIIQLKFDQKLDLEMGWEFYSDQEFGGCNFWKERALAHHPKLSEIEMAKNPHLFLDQYISEFYNIHSSEMNGLSQKTPLYLSESQDLFFELVDKIFNHYPWPKKEFVGIFSIFDFCPRFIDSGSFQIFLYDNRRMQLFTIFHEMLHFIFYAYAQKTFPEKFTNLNTDEGKFWDLAEIFNAVIQDTDDFIKLHGKIEGIGYPNHQEMIITGKDLWKNNPNINGWITEMMKTLSK